METERMRGNPAGTSNMHVAANIRAARHAIGMDLRAMSEGLQTTGRKLSTSGISKVENGDRRVDVDDLTAIAYLLRTTPAELLTPPAGAANLTGVPERYLPEEIERWTRGAIVLTDEGLVAYWQQEWVVCMNRIRFLESALERMSSPNAAPATVEAYSKQLTEAQAREHVIKERGVQIDPSGRVFNHSDYLDRISSTDN